MHDRPLEIVTPSALSPHEGDDVHGMHGRVRLAKGQGSSPDSLVSPTGAPARKKPGETWMDEERRNVQAYEYLCHIGEVKEWVEACIGEEIDQVSELEESMRNGIAIAKLARFFAPTEVRRIFEGPKLQFRHIDNINFLFGAMKQVGLPEIFFFETTDLYDKKNIPKVIYCLHALAHLLFKKKMAPSIKNLIGKLEFTEDEINATQKGLEDAGISLPVFGDISSTLEKELKDAAGNAGGSTVEEVAPEPELTEEQTRDLYWSDKEEQLRLCQNIARAHKERKAMLERKALHREFANPDSGALIKFQAFARGVLVRRRARAKLAEIRKATPHIIQLQAICRGHLARKQYRERIGYLKSHNNEIVKIQSKFRTHAAQKAFESLMRGENPPVGTIRNYVHLLLSTSDKEFDEELELERLRQEVVTMIRENTAIEASLNELDNKIALLVKNRITVEEVVKTAKRGKITDSRDRLALSTDELDTTNNMATLVGNLKSRDKESRKRLEAYQQLFYMLQTEPTYLAKLLFFMNKATAGEKQKKFVENIVLTIFGYAQNAREEYLLLKLFQLSINEEMSIVTEISEFLRGNPVFIKLAVQYNRGAKEMRYLRDLLKPRVKDVMGNRDLDLQTDPLIIYKSSIANEELQTGKKSQRPYEVTREQALADEDTRSVYIKHLQELRTCADGFLEAIIGGVSTMPYGIRCIARQLRVAFATKFGSTNEEQIMKVIGHFLYYRYMNPAIVAPEAFDVIETQVDPAQRKNLAEISKVLNQVSNGKGFTDDNIFLQPLNDYVISASQKFGSYLKLVTEVPEPETQFQVDEFQDVTQTQKPVIYVSPQEIFMTHTVIARSIDEIAPRKDDPLRELLTELGPTPDINLEKESKAGLPTPLTLTKRYTNMEGEKMETRQLWVETKRCIMYIITVQSGKNLLDVLEKPVTALENERYQALLLQEQEEIIRNDDRSPTKSEPSLAASASKSILKSQTLGVDIWSFTFDQLKKTALENMAKLEVVGKVTKNNHYQDMLNDIAKNIRDKHRRRQRRKQELDSIRQTLVNLNEKRVYLNEQKKSYNDYISGCMGQLKSKKDKAKRGRVMPFSHQYYHLRELKKSGKVPQFGSYKYTGDRLLQKGVLISVADYSAKQLEKITLTISSDEAGVFHIVATLLGVKLPGGEEEIRLEDLLQLQFDGVQVMDLFDDAAKVNVNLLIFLINKKFYV